MYSIKQNDKLKSKAGSITVEAVFIVPLFIFAMLALIGIISWFKTAENIQKKLVDSTRMMAVGEYLVDEHIKSETKNDIISLSMPYVVDVKAPLPGIIKPFVMQKCTVRAFVGIETLETSKEDEIVYMTPHGEVIHRNINCSYIKSSIKAIDSSMLNAQRNKSGAKYYRCEKCVRDGKPADMVYISIYGTKYHNNALCSAIAKNAYPVKLSSVKNKRFCSKCGGK